MQHNTAFLEIKALLTLTLLKSGTSVRDIQTAVNVASTARMMVAEESIELDGPQSPATQNIAANITPMDGRRANASKPNAPRKSPPISGLNADIKALLSLLLLQ